MIRTAILFFLCLILSTPVAAQTAESNESLALGLSALIKLQADDGGWHSQHYGSLKQGAALTTLVLYSLSHVPEDIRKPYAESINRAFQFLKPGLTESGYVTNSERSEDYPVYCTAMLLVASQRLERPFDEITQDRMLEYLLQSQVAEARGFSNDHLEYGGWDVLGPDTQAGKTSGTSVSVTCYVTESLKEFDDRQSVEKSLKLAQQWLDRICQSSTDGGLFFTPRRDSINNKAQWLDEKFEQPRSYGSATTDGLRIMRYCGRDPESKSVQGAKAWLIANPSLESVPGFGPEDRGWRDSLRFYYYASLAKTLPMLSEDAGQTIRAELKLHLNESQAQNGLWQNSSALMREDDPLIATSFSVMTLGLIEAAGR